jgi:hypothetical protein
MLIEFYCDMLIASDDQRNYSKLKSRAALHLYGFVNWGEKN